MRHSELCGGLLEAGCVLWFCASSSVFLDLSRTADCNSLLAQIMALSRDCQLLYRGGWLHVTQYEKNDLDAHF